MVLGLPRYVGAKAMRAFIFFTVLFGVAGIGWILGADYNARQFGYAFGCGRFYAGNFDPADDPRDERSKCYPYYKSWEATETWPARK